MEIRPLKDIGLTEVEANVYLALLEKGPSSTGVIIKKTGFHKATVYQTLERLQEKGIVSYIVRGKIKIFQAVNPNILLEQLKEKEENLKNILPELLQKTQLAKEKIRAEIYHGKKGIISVYRDVLNYKDYLNLGAGIPIVEILGDFFYQFQKIKKQKRIKAKILVSEKIKGTKITKEIVGEYKYLPKEFEGPTNTIIYGNKIAIIVWSDLIAFILESKETNKVYRKYFDVLWKIAKK